MCLIDTHVLIWFMFDESELSDTALETIKNDDSVYVSIASLWEIAIKQNLGKIDLECSIQELAEKCDEAGIEILNIKPGHLEKIKDLPDIHRDPFDRLLIAQAMSENLRFVTKDSKIPGYNIEIVW